jgi:hypothetical protein
MDQGSDVLE